VEAHRARSTRQHSEGVVVALPLAAVRPEDHVVEEDTALLRRAAGLDVRHLAGVVQGPPLHAQAKASIAGEKSHRHFVAVGILEGLLYFGEHLKQTGWVDGSSSCHLSSCFPGTIVSVIVGNYRSHLLDGLFS